MHLLVRALSQPLGAPTWHDVLGAGPGTEDGDRLALWSGMASPWGRSTRLA